jgi:hypothetical protein
LPTGGYKARVESPGRQSRHQQVCMAIQGAKAGCANARYSPPHKSTLTLKVHVLPPASLVLSRSQYRKRRLWRCRSNERPTGHQVQMLWIPLRTVTYGTDGVSGG